MRISRREFFALTGLAGATAMLAGCGSTERPSMPSQLRFVTGGESGTYYALGSVIAQHATNNTPYRVTAASSGGSQANIQELEDGVADMGFCQSDVMAYAYNGTNLFEGTPVDCFSVLAALYQEQVQVVTCDPDIKTIADLKGKNVSIGAAGSGVYFNAIDILGAYGLTESDISPTYQSFGDSTDSLKDNKIQAAFIVAGAPTTAIVDLATTTSAYIVGLDDEHIESLIATSDYYSEATIEAGTYRGQDSDAKTVGVDAVLLINDNIADEMAYAVAADIFDNAASMVSNHAKFAEINLEKGASVTSVPYHPGAAKYFAEKGFDLATK